MRFRLGIQGSSLYVYRNPNDVNGCFLGGKIQMIYKLRRFVLDREPYPDCNKTTQTKIVEDLNLILRPCGFQIKPKQLPKETQDRKGQRFRLCCANNSKKHKCKFHLTLIFFFDFGWCLTLTRGQPRGMFMHTCHVSARIENASNGEALGLKKYSEKCCPAKHQFDEDCIVSTQGDFAKCCGASLAYEPASGSAEFLSYFPIEKSEESSFEELIMKEELIAELTGGSEYQQGLLHTWLADHDPANAEVERTNQRDSKQETTPRENRANSNSSAPPGQSLISSRVVTPEHEKQTIENLRNQQGKFIPLPYLSEKNMLQVCQPIPSVKPFSSLSPSKLHYRKPRPLKSLPKQPHNLNGEPALTLVKFQKQPRPEAVPSAQGHPLSPPTLQNFAKKTPPPKFGDWSPIALQESPRDGQDDWSLFSDDVLDILRHPLSG